MSSSDVEDEVHITELPSEAISIKKSLDDKWRSLIEHEKMYNIVVKNLLTKHMGMVLKYYLSLDDIRTPISCSYSKIGKNIAKLKFRAHLSNIRFEFDCDKLSKWGRPYDIIQEWILEYLKEIPNLKLAIPAEEREKRYPLAMIFMDETYFKRIEEDVVKKIMTPK